MLSHQKKNKSLFRAVLSQTNSTLGSIHYEKRGDKLSNCNITTNVCKSSFQSSCTFDTHADAHTQTHTLFCLPCCRSQQVWWRLRRIYRDAQSCSEWNTSDSTLDWTSRLEEIRIEHAHIVHTFRRVLWHSRVSHGHAEKRPVENRNLWRCKPWAEVRDECDSAFLLPVTSTRITCSDSLPLLLPVTMQCSSVFSTPNYFV